MVEYAILAASKNDKKLMNQVANSTAAYLERVALGEIEIVTESKRHQ